MNKIGFQIIIISVIIYFLSSCNEVTEEKGATTHSDTTALTKDWEKAIPNQAIPEGLVSLKAKDCGTCHQEIYNEWTQSTHAVAWQDLQFQAEWKKDTVYVCLNCHIPLQNQQEFIVTGLINGDYNNPVKKPNPYFDKDFQQESISCATCHIRNGSVIGTTGITTEAHKTIKDTEFLSETLCLGCHNVVEELNPVLACSFETGDEWRKNWAGKAGKNCISCHMPTTERPIAKDANKRTSHFHYFPASGIPKFKNKQVIGLNGLEIRTDDVKSNYVAGEKLKYNLVLKNSYAGHKVPTGDPERFFLIKFQIQDADSNILKEKQYRIGEEWQWYPVAKKLSDNNLNPLEERAFAFEYQIPNNDDLFLILQITKHRMSKENAEFMGILEDYPISITVFEKKYLLNN